jgi:translation elongation factor EF-Tu-like GTPase
MFEITVESMFHIAGQGTVLAGHVRSGRVSIGDKLEVRSPTKSARSVVAGLEAYRNLLHHADAGTDVGVLLRDFAPDSVNDGLERDESNAWRVVSLVLHGVPKPWWKLW